MSNKIHKKLNLNDLIIIILNDMEFYIIILFWEKYPFKDNDRYINFKKWGQYIYYITRTFYILKILNDFFHSVKTREAKKERLCERCEPFWPFGQNLHMIKIELLFFPSVFAHFHWEIHCMNLLTLRIYLGELIHAQLFWWE